MKVVPITHGTNILFAGADPGGGGRTRRAPPKIGKKYDFFGVKS